MDKPITVELLKRMRACPASVALFGRMFPDGASWDEVRQAYAPGGRASCVVAEDQSRLSYEPLADLSWFVVNCPVGTVPELTWAERVINVLPDWRTALAVACPPDVPGATWENRLALCDAPAHHEFVVMNCPYLKQGDTWKARVALLRSASSRASFAVRCPEGVAGATRKARERLLWRAAPDVAAAMARERLVGQDVPNNGNHKRDI